MFVQKCRKCSKNFRWTTIVTSLLKGLGHPIECLNCNTKYYMKMVYRVIITVLIPLPILFHNFLYEIFKSYSSLFYIIWIFIIIVLFPFFVRYDTKEI
ncbi:TIGR04104 family putative zinc finger protein [Clostridium felsineum]|uniref:Uncharacterized protein n=1 Tax=Clostridium felsineum TaxID=36839 RepID=A0A1S8LEZ9_9CLOT|nr:hypothetical protein CLROS_027430 [Clostridium felsineum]URZ12436.1 hypothetical protein CROST_031580 [Clostridium felsineum]